MLNEIDLKGAPSGIRAYDLLWKPDPLSLKHAFVDEFRERINLKYRSDLQNYEDLYQWSVDQLEAFWSETWDYLDPIVSRHHDKVLTAAPMEEVPEWFQGCQLNFAENLLRFRDDRPAIISIVEGQIEGVKLTFAQLYQQVTQIASALKAVGIKKGDHVAGYLPNCSDTVAIMLGVAAVGAVWCCTSPDFGVTGTVDRLVSVAPKVLFTVEAVRYNQKVHDNLLNVEKVSKMMKFDVIVVVPFLRPEAEINIKNIPKSLFMKDFLGSHMQQTTLEFEQVPFNHPVYVLFSSGTTGRPKCLVHSVGGTLIQHLKELKMHFNLTRKDLLMFYTTAAWMMWHWEVSALALGCPIVCYDGSSFSPKETIVWDIVDHHKVTVLGLSAKMVSMMEDKGIHPRETHDLISLRAILTTGSPLSPHSYDFVYAKVKSNVMLSSITGGSDIISLFGAGCPTLPVYRGLIQCRGLGMAVECFDEQGNPVRDQPGELVCTKPFPSMPVFFLNDTGIKYRSTYFGKFPHIWVHGDLCMITTDPPGIAMLGRSDATLNPNGVRFGSADIYHIVETFPEVADSVCVGQVNKVGDERVVLFLKLADGVASLSEDLVQRMKRSIREELSPRHVPAVVMAVPDIPYTINGKKVELAIKRIISYNPVMAAEENLSSLANPGSLQFFRGSTDLKLWAINEK